MKKSLLLLLPVLAASNLTVFAEDAACSCCVVPVATTEAQTPASHPLKGVVVDILTERSALLVKHEAVPGVMKAMTMMLKVDDDALKSAKKGQAITGNLIKKDDGWWLEDVKSVKLD